MGAQVDTEKEKTYQGALPKLGVHHISDSHTPAAHRGREHWTPSVDYRSRPLPPSSEQLGKQLTRPPGLVGVISVLPSNNKHTGGRAAQTVGVQHSQGTDKMAAQHRPQTKDTDTQPSLQPIAALDRLCKSFWAILRSSGATHVQAMRAVATRCRHYDAMLRVRRTTARWTSLKRPAKQETLPGHTGANTRPHPRRNLSAAQAPQASSSLCPRLRAQRGILGPSAVAAAYRITVSMSTLTPVGDSESQHRGATESTCQHRLGPQEHLNRLTGNAIKASRTGIG
ncbi:Hypothetical predicted protein [Pelobates cultripes]|uniref:Uncharacterized protein n=1 Tax=Pelobates cultripes TaxID=61616 RepID=A0AAD1RWV1_PELCU|nr:Hypothetical predicted protein [Pelobates cultripes]